MAYDEALAERVRGVLAARPGVHERRMFGGLAFMLGGNMACCVMRDQLLVRIDPEEAAAALRAPHVSTFGRMGARPMRGFVAVAAEGVAGDHELERWVETGAARAASLPEK